MKLFLFLILINIANLNYAQKNTLGKIKIEKTDTVDYAQLPFGILNQYTLRKITQYNGQTIYDMNGRQLFFGKVTDSVIIRKDNPLCLNIPSLNDTLITINWDSNTKDVHNTPNHLVGHVHLNKSNNILIITTSRIEPKTKKCSESTKLLKIQKLTFT